MLMKVFSVTVPNPYIGEGSKNADRVAPAGETQLSYFTVFAKDLEDARLAFVEFCNRGSRVPTLTNIIELGNDDRVRNRVVVPQLRVIKDYVDVITMSAEQAKNVLRNYINDGSDPVLAEAIQRVVQLDEFVAFKGLKSTLQADVEIEEVPLSELQGLADEVSDDVNQKLSGLKNTGLSHEKLSFIERLTSKRGG